MIGLGYILKQIRQAIVDGVIKPEVSADKKGAIGKFGNVLEKAA